MSNYERSLEFSAHFNFMIELTPHSSQLTKNRRGDFFQVIKVIFGVVNYRDPRKIRYFTPKSSKMTLMTLKKFTPIIFGRMDPLRCQIHFKIEMSTKFSRIYISTYTTQISNPPYGSPCEIHFFMPKTLKLLSNQYYCHQNGRHFEFFANICFKHYHNWYFLTSTSTRTRQVKSSQLI